MPSLGVPELIIVFLIIIVLFGASRIPQIGKGLGEGIRNFKKGLKGVDGEDEPEQIPEKRRARGIPDALAAPYMTPRRSGARARLIGAPAVLLVTSQHLAHIRPGFPVGGHAAIPGHGRRSRVVGGERQLEVAVVILHQAAEVAAPHVDVGVGVEEVARCHRPGRRRGAPASGPSLPWGRRPRA